MTTWGIAIALGLAACGGSPAARPLATSAPQGPPPQVASSSPSSESPPPPQVASGAPDPTGRPPSKRAVEVLVRMRAFRDELCVCKDKPCAERVTAEMTRWGQELSENPAGEEKVSEQDTHDMSVIVDAMTKCLTAAMMAGQQGSGPAPSSP